MNVMLLAAGEGRRLRPYTEILPKPAMPFLNIPLAAHALGFLHDLDIDTLVVNTHHLSPKIHELFHQLPQRSHKLYFSDESKELLGSGGGLNKARDHFKNGGDFILMNADEVILPKNSRALTQAIGQHKLKSTLATLLVTEHSEVGRQFGGVWTDAHHKVLGFGKEPIPGSVKGWHFIGVQILSEKVFAFMPEDPNTVTNILYDVLKRAIEHGEQVEAFPLNCEWFETGNLQNFLEASRRCLDILKAPPSPLKDALVRTLKNFGAPAVVENLGTTDLLRVHKEKIPDHVRMDGFVCLGKGASLPSTCLLKNVIVGEGVRVAEGTNAQNTLLL